MKKYGEKTFPETTVKTVVTTCDCCGKLECSVNCCLCGRDICCRCECRDPEDSGDYPDRYCPICWNLKFNKYKRERIGIKNKELEDLKLIDEKIKQESLNL